MRGFSRGEILKGRYPLAWRKVQCYECGGIGHKRSDHREKTKEVEKKELGKTIKKDKKEKDKIKKEKENVMMDISRM